jgi:hypothetical protein
MAILQGKSVKERALLQMALIVTFKCSGKLRDIINVGS